MRRSKLPINYCPENSKLSFIGVIPGTDKKLITALYKCVCGNFCEGLVNNVKMGKKLSCGCHRAALKSNLKHGLANHPLYSVWENMTSRCLNPNVESYSRYGGRGVKICDEWVNSPESFIDWGIKHGWQDGLQLDKDILGDGLLYSPQTCVFVTPKINSNNRKDNRLIEFNGISKTLAQWADGIGINHSALHSRLKKWTVEKSLTTLKTRL